MRLLLLLSVPLLGCPQPARTNFDSGPSCGDGTVEVDGWCLPEDEGGDDDDDDEAPCGDGTIEIAGECVAAEQQWVGFPLTEGDTAILGQTFHGNFSHQDKARYAVDIPLSEGTPLAAMRGGTVIGVKEDSNIGCGDPECSDDGNFVKIDHGDGTQGLYFHLERNGAQVEIGDGVCAGEVIGYSGNTGFSTGPHLHAAVQNPFGLSLPLYFYELDEANGGVPAAGQVVVSENTQDTDCSPPPPASCDEDLFAFLGVRLDPGTPCSLVDRDVVYPVTGRISHGSGAVVGTWRLDPVNGGSAWSYQCFIAEDDGSFEAEVVWPSEAVGEGSYLVIGAAEPDCTTYSGWAYSARITFR